MSSDIHVVSHFLCRKVHQFLDGSDVWAFVQCNISLHVTKVSLELLGDRVFLFSLGAGG